jgi:hypothetical protein
MLSLICFLTIKFFRFMNVLFTIHSKVEKQSSKCLNILRDLCELTYYHLITIDYLLAFALSFEH